MSVPFKHHSCCLTYPLWVWDLHGAHCVQRDNAKFDLKCNFLTYMHRMCRYQYSGTSYDSMIVILRAYTNMILCITPRGLRTKNYPIEMLQDYILQTVYFIHLFVNMKSLGATLMRQAPVKR